MIPRRNQMQQWHEAERQIYEAVQTVERMGADVRLTDAVVLLGAARDRVADFVDGVEGKRTFARVAPAPAPEPPDPKGTFACPVCGLEVPHRHSKIDLDASEYGAQLRQRGDELSVRAAECISGLVYWTACQDARERAARVSERPAPEQAERPQEGDDRVIRALAAAVSALKAGEPWHYTGCARCAEIEAALTASGANEETPHEPR